MDRAQREKRQKGLTATEMATILGRNPYQNELTLYAQKTQPLPEDDDPGNEAMQTGVALQPWLAGQYRVRHQTPILLDSTRTYQHPTCRIALATPDGLLFPDAGAVRVARVDLAQAPARIDAVWEAKTTGITSHVRDLEIDWGRPGSDEIPEPYLIQVQWQMFVCAAKLCHLSALIGGRGYTEFIIEGDPELWAMMQERAQAWWDKYIIRATPPEAVDGSDETKHALQAIHRRVSEDKTLLQSTPNIDELAANFKAAEEALHHAKDEYAEHGNRFRRIIGSEYGVKGKWGKLIWPQAKDHISLDKEALLEDLLPHVPIELATALRAKHTRAVPGLRTLRAYWRKEE